MDFRVDFYSQMVGWTNVLQRCEDGFSKTVFMSSLFILFWRVSVETISRRGAFICQASRRIDFCNRTCFLSQRTSHNKVDAAILLHGERGRESVCGIAVSGDNWYIRNSQLSISVLIGRCAAKKEFHSCTFTPFRIAVGKGETFNLLSILKRPNKNFDESGK